MSRRWVGVTASSTGQAHWSARRSPWRHCSPADAATARPPSPPYFWSDQYGVRIQFAGIAGPDDDITFEEGGPDEGSFLAVYRRGNQPIAVLGVDQPRLFTRWRRQLTTAPISV
jgi:Reductase C-terminal